MPPRGAYRKNPGEQAITVSGEASLIAARLRLAVDDARGRGAGGECLKWRREAIALLTDPEAMAWWCSLMGAEVEVVQPALLRAAGLEGDTHTIQRKGTG